MNGSSSGLTNGTPGTQQSMEQAELKSIVAANEGIMHTSTKSDAISSSASYPQPIATSARKFFKGSSNAYNKFTISKMADGSYHFTMEKPGNVPGSKAVYHKIVNAEGKTIEVYKDTFDPHGKLVHRKDK